MEILVDRRNVRHDVVTAETDIFTDRKSMELCEVRAFDVTSSHRSISALSSDKQRKLSVLRQTCELTRDACQCPTEFQTCL